MARSTLKEREGNNTVHSVRPSRYYEPNPVWYTQETIRGAFPPSVPIEKRFVASLYTVYLDESGTHPESDAAVAAGFVSNVTQWDAFSQRWGRVLDEFGIEFFHMTDFENRRGQFTGWSDDRRKALLDGLLPIIQEHTFWSIGCIVLRSSFDSILSEVTKRVCGDAYGVAALACWRHLGIILKDNDAWMDCIMEVGSKGSGALYLLFQEDSRIPEWQDEHRILGLSFREKRVFLPLQAADVLAYELYKQSQRQFGQDKRPTRYPLKELARKKHKWVYMQEKHLVDLEHESIKQIRQIAQSRGLL